MDSSQLRQDLITGDWVLIAPGRSKRHGDDARPARIITASAECPFEDITKIQPPPIHIIGTPENWRLAVVPNKYPALTESSTCPLIIKEDLYTHLTGTGRHSMLITREHGLPVSQLPEEGVREIIETLQTYAKEAAEDPCCQYVSIFQNWGPLAGASQYHPHFQMLALSVVPPHVQHSIDGSAQYHRITGQCAHCEIIEHELAAGQRIVYENKVAVVISPYASRSAYELRIYPKLHTAKFEMASIEQLQGVSQALSQALTLLRTKVGDPDYNCFVHGAPVKETDQSSSYHWHLEIVPKFGVAAGFELGTGIMINPVSPEEATQRLTE